MSKRLTPHEKAEIRRKVFATEIVRLDLNGVWEAQVKDLRPAFEKAGVPFATPSQVLQFADRYVSLIRSGRRVPVVFRVGEAAVWARDYLHSLVRHEPEASPVREAAPEPGPDPKSEALVAPVSGPAPRSLGDEFRMEHRVTLDTGILFANVGVGHEYMLDFAGCSYQDVIDSMNRELNLIVAGEAGPKANLKLLGCALALNGRTYA